MPRPRSPSALAAALLGAAALLPPARAYAQASCTWVDPTRSVQVVTIPGQGQIVYLGAPSIRCTDGVRFQADSAVAYPSQSMTQLMGHVRFRDQGKQLTADEGRYFSRQGRLQASGNAVLRDTLQGSEIRNGDMVLLRRNDARETDQITVTTAADGVRPRARLYMKPPAADSSAAPGAPRSVPARAAPDSAAVADTLAAADTTAITAADTGAVADTAAVQPEPAPIVPQPPADTAKTPYVVVGDRLFLQGDQYFLASGNVVVERDSLTAWADTAEYDQVAARMLLKGSARMEGETYTLAGRTINVALPGGEVGNVRAVREGVLTGEDLRLEAPLVQLFMADGLMERLVATPLPGDPSRPPTSAADSADLARPVAVAEKFRLTADSVEVMAPGEVLNSLHAVGRAIGVSSARDSLNVPSLPEIARKDWLEGDTIVATFTKLEEEDFAPGDTVREGYRIDQLVARGSAKSLYRLLPSDSTSRPGLDAPAIHYVTGDAILIAFVEGEVDRMEVTGPTHGWHLEPGRRLAKDSLAVPDTVPPPDTGRARAPDRVGDSRSGVLREDAGTTREGGSGKGVALPGAAPRQRGRARGSRR